MSDSLESRKAERERRSIAIRPADARDVPSISGLLAGAKLPTAGIAEHVDSFVETAEDFFARRGYRTISRSEAPAQIAAS